MNPISNSDGKTFGDLARSESYKLKSCAKVLRQKKEIDSDAIQSTQKILPFNIFGLTVSGIHLSLIQNISLTLKARLMPGSRKIMAIDRDAKIKVSKNTDVSLGLVLLRDKDGVLALKNLTINFSKPIRIKNPSASLQKNTGNKSRKKTAIKDKLTDVTLSKTEIDDAGNVRVNGHLKALRMLKFRLPPNAAKIEVLKLDDQLLGKLGISGEAASEASTEKLGIRDFDLKKLLLQLGAITPDISYTFKVTGDRSRISFLKENSFFRGENAPLMAEFAGTIRLDEAGNLSIAIEGNRSKIDCSIGSFRPEVLANIHHLGEGAPVAVDLRANISGQSKRVKADTFSNKAVKDILPRRRAEHPHKTLAPSSENEFNASFGSKKIDVFARVDVKADIKHTLLRATGSASLNATAHAPYVKTSDRGLSMDGRVKGYLKFSDFVYEKEKKRREGNGTMGFSLHPSKRTRSIFPELKATKFDYGLTLKDRGRGRIAPPDYGLSRFVRPVKNLEGHQERIDAALSTALLHSIGSKEYFETVEKITGGKLRDASKVKLLIDGVASMPERLRMINNAKESICFQTLAFKDDASGWLYAQALADAARRGVKIFGIIDSLGNMEKLSDLERPNPIYEFLRKNNVHLKIYNNPLEVGLRAIFQLAEKYPLDFQVENPKSLMSIAQVLRFLEQVVLVSENKKGRLSQDERIALKNALHTLFNGKPLTSPEIAVGELKTAVKINLLRLPEILMLIKRIGDVSYRWHEKYLVVDHKEAIVGGMNIADEYLRGGTGERVTIGKKEQPVWRDTDVLLEGDIVADVYRSFRRNWLHVAMQKLPIGKIVKRIGTMDRGDHYAASIIQHRPLEDGDHKISNYLLYNLRTLKAGERAWFETAYFLPRGALRELQKQLVAAARGGVDVRILTNSEATSDFRSLVQASVFDLRELLEAGARVFLRNKERMVHAKVTVLGDKLTLVGSWNCDNRSESHDSEDVCTIYDRRTNQEMTKVLLNDMMEQSDEITLQDLDNRKLSKELMSAATLLIGEVI